LRVVRLDLAREELQYLAIAVDEVLAEIPARLGKLGGEELVNRRLGRQRFQDIDLFEEGKGDAIFIGAERLDFLRRAGLLLLEVIGGKSEDEETLG
jgi:hypothetical protein